MISSVGVTDDTVDKPQQPPDNVSAAYGPGRSSPAWIADADEVPADTALVVLRGEDGLLRLRPADITVPVHTHPAPDGGQSLSRYEHVQTTASDTWVVPHGLGRRPVAWSLYDDQGRECCEYVVEHPEMNRAVVRMDVPTTGTLYLI